MPFRSNLLLAALVAAWLPSFPRASPPEPGSPGAASSPPVRWAQSPPSAARRLLWLDPDQSPLSGADNILFLQGALGRLEDRLLPTRLFEREGFLKRASSISYRTAKVLFLDLAPASYLPLVQHEVFGHGYRAREAGLSDIRYELNPPPPYGRGDGSTSWTYPDAYLETTDRRLAMDLAGIEAADVLTGRLRGRWLRESSLDYHEALLYIGSAMGLANYVAVTDGNGTDMGNDITSWLNDINAKTRESPGDARWMDLERLEKGGNLAYADPCLWFSAWTAMRYLWSGESRWSYPMIPLGPVRWLPMLGYRLTPFGDQWVAENLLQGGGRAIQARFSRGSGRAGSTWGADLEAGDAFAWRGFSLDASLSLWRQPPLWLDGGAAPPAGGEALGFGLRADLVSPALGRALPLRLAAGVGAKQAGYVPGEALDGGVTFRAGLGL